MSTKSTGIPERLLRYVAERTRGDDAFLGELKEAAREAGLPEIWIAPEQVSLIRVLLGLSSARRVLELGTLAGYAAVSLARALPEDGELLTVELDERHADFAERWIARSDVADRVRVLRGDAKLLLTELDGKSFDAVFVDADKDGYPVYLEEAARLLRDDGLLLVDNAFGFGQILDDEPADGGARVLKRFNEVLASDERFEGIIVPLGDGMWVARRLPRG